VPLANIYLIPCLHRQFLIVYACLATAVLLTSLDQVSPKFLPGENSLLLITTC
jgi:hypothetical protein